MFDLPDEFPTPSGSFQIRKDEKNRQDCPVQLNQDFSDYFVFSQLEGWRELTVPNDREIEEYGTGEPLKGLAVICYINCPWGK